MDLAHRRARCLDSGLCRFCGRETGLQLTLIPDGNNEKFYGMVGWWDGSPAVACSGCGPVVPASGFGLQQNL